MGKLITIAVASSAFAGVIGALATAATQSQVSPSAIGAAVQGVGDQKAESTLRCINGRVGTTNTALGALRTTLNSDLNALASYLGNDSNGALHGVVKDIQQICEKPPTQNRSSAVT